MQFSLRALLVTMLLSGPLLSMAWWQWHHETALSPLAVSKIGVVASSAYLAIRLQLPREISDQEVIACILALGFGLMGIGILS